MMLAEQPYEVSDDVQVKKLDCVGHIQKRLESALRDLKQRYYFASMQLNYNVGYRTCTDVGTERVYPHWMSQRTGVFTQGNTSGHSLGYLIVISVLLIIADTS